MRLSVCTEVVAVAECLVEEIRVAGSTRGWNVYRSGSTLASRRHRPRHLEVLQFMAWQRPAVERPVGTVHP
jgi:hypothetical protein